MALFRIKPWYKKRYKEKVVYYGTALPFSQTKKSSQLAATSVGNYALFGGGVSSSSYACPTDVHAYDTSLTRTYLSSSLSVGRQSLAATSVGDYAIFGGGFVQSSGYPTSYSHKNTTDAYNTSLTKGSLSVLNLASGQLAATSVGNYALFGGGRTGSSSTYTIPNMTAYDTSLTRTQPTELSLSRSQLAATSVGNYALFGGGYNKNSGSTTTTFSSVVDAYDTSLTRTIPTELSSARSQLAAASVGNYALFGGGFNQGVCSNNIDAYDTSLTRTNTATLSVARLGLAATTIKDFALFGGGFPNSSSRLATVDAYDKHLTRTIPTELSVGRNSLAATTVGDYALFGGGQTDSSYDTACGTVDVYIVE